MIQQPTFTPIHPSLRLDRAYQWARPQWVTRDEGIGLRLTRKKLASYVFLTGVEPSLLLTQLRAKMPPQGT